jgi:hypothetical protein
MTGREEARSLAFRIEKDSPGEKQGPPAQSTMRAGTPVPDAHSQGGTMSDAPQVSKDEQNWAMICHLSALLGFVFPFGNIIGPLVVWLLKRAEMPLVDTHGKEALNFQITVSIGVLICIPLVFVLIGIPLLFAIGLAALILTIMAAVKISNGELNYQYPFAIRLLK